MCILTNTFPENFQLSDSRFLWCCWWTFTFQGICYKLNNCESISWSSPVTYRRMHYRNKCMKTYVVHPDNKTAHWNSLSWLDVYILCIGSPELVCVSPLHRYKDDKHWLGSGVRDHIPNQPRLQLHRNSTQSVEFCTVPLGTCLKADLPHSYFLSYIKSLGLFNNAMSTT
jgi:hypothetical protein